MFSTGLNKDCKKTSITHSVSKREIFKKDSERVTNFNLITQLLNDRVIAYCLLFCVHEGIWLTYSWMLNLPHLWPNLWWTVRNNSWIMHSKSLKNSAYCCKLEPEFFPTKGKFQGFNIYLMNQMHHRTRSSKNQLISKRTMT